MARKKLNSSPGIAAQEDGGQKALSDRDLLDILEQRFASRLTITTNILKEAHLQKPLTGKDLSPVLPTLNRVFLAKILLRIIALGEAEEGADRETLSTLWYTANQLMDQLMGTLSSSSPVSHVAQKIERLHRHIARKEKHIAGQIGQAQQQIHKAHARIMPRSSPQAPAVSG
ncbi:hypothetical protein Cva_01619 [Caedimonas varicaedens]|uniref:Uncharacterized protein n=1 Tax=Caedimonas varicaedens TaxID=1629334 RepID=A0A0K8MGG5_9PROT|nr:hypothetical protein Cva_01619 [Caedimonas varicaedens]